VVHSDDDPPALHQRLTAEAAERGLTLSEYLLQAERAVEKPTIEELTRRIESRQLAKLRTHPAELIRADRDSH
jgi:hypothetical protein